MQELVNEKKQLSSHNELERSNQTQIEKVSNAILR